MRRYLWDITCYVTSFVWAHFCNVFHATLILRSHFIDTLYEISFGRDRIFTVSFNISYATLFHYTTSFKWCCLCDASYWPVFIQRRLCDAICARLLSFLERHYCDFIIAISLLRFLLCDFIQVILFERFNLSGITFQRRYDGRHWIRRRLLLCHLSVGEVWQNWKSGKFKIPIRIINQQPMKPN